MITIPLLDDELDAVREIYGCNRTIRYPFKRSLLDLIDTKYHCLVQVTLHKHKDEYKAYMYYSNFNTNKNGEIAFLPFSEDIISGRICLVDLIENSNYNWDLKMKAIKTIHSILPLVYGVMNYIVDYYTNNEIIRSSFKEHDRDSIITKIMTKEAEDTDYGEKFIDLESLAIKYLSDDDHPKNHHSSPTHEFDVRGHYRTYKSGKCIWIDPYTKCKGKGMVQDKTLIIDNEKILKEDDIHV